MWWATLSETSTKHVEHAVFTRGRWRSEPLTPLSTSMPSPIDPLANTERPSSAVALCVCPRLSGSHSRTSTQPVYGRHLGGGASDSGRRIPAHAQSHSGQARPNRPSGPIVGGNAGDSVVRVSEHEQPCEHDGIDDANVCRGRRSWWRWSVVIRDVARSSSTRSPCRSSVVRCGSVRVPEPPQQPLQIDPAVMPRSSAIRLLSAAPPERPADTPDSNVSRWRMDPKTGRCGRTRRSAGGRRGGVPALLHDERPDTQQIASVLQWNGTLTSSCGLGNRRNR